MQHLVAEITERTKQVWATILDAELIVNDASTKGHIGPILTSWVQISGPWSGALVLHCGIDAARNATSLMLEMDSRDIGSEELLDAVGELANMIGGSVKALLPQPARLGLPHVIEAEALSIPMAGGREVCRVGFEWKQAPVVAVLVRYDCENGDGN